MSDHRVARAVNVNVPTCWVGALEPPTNHVRQSVAVASALIGADREPNRAEETRAGYSPPQPRRLCGRGLGGRRYADQHGVRRTAAVDRQHVRRVLVVEPHGSVRLHGNVARPRRRISGQHGNRDVSLRVDAPDAALPIDPRHRGVVEVESQTLVLTIVVGSNDGRRRRSCAFPVRDGSTVSLYRPTYFMTPSVRSQSSASRGQCVMGLSVDLKPKACPPSAKR